MKDSRWYIDCNDSKLLINKLSKFFMEYQALSQELSEAKPLGTCKITTLGNPKPVFRSLDSMLKSGNDIMKTVIIRTKNGQEEET